MHFIFSGVYIDPHSPALGGGEFIKYFGEEFQVVKRGREFMGFWEEYHVEKSVSGSDDIFYDIKAVGTEIFGKKIKILKMGVGKNIKL